MGDFWHDFWVRFGVTILITPIAVISWKTCEAAWHRWYNYRLRKLAARHALACGVKQVALAISVGDDIEESVRGFLKERGLIGQGADIPLLKVHQAEGFSEIEGQWFRFLERVKEQIRTIRSEGFTRVHVFARVPVPLALMVGATLTNGPAAFLYHFNAGRYFPVGQITFETVKL